MHICRYAVYHLTILSVGTQLKTLYCQYYEHARYMYTYTTKHAVIGSQCNAIPDPDRQTVHQKLTAT